MSNVTSISAMKLEYENLSKQVQQVAEFLMTADALNLSNLDMSLLHKQLAAMTQYLDVLNERIKVHNHEGA